MTTHTFGPAAAALSLAAVMTLAGCNADGPSRPLTAEAFVRQRPAATVGNPVDQPGALAFNDGPADPDAGAADARARADAEATRAHGIGKTVRESVRSPDAAAAGTGPDQTVTPATGPAPRAPGAPTGVSTGNGDVPAVAVGTGPTTPGPTTRGADGAGAPDEGQFKQDRTVGFVLMDVNGNPIYSDKVLNAIEKPLEIEAKRNPPARFRKIAELLVGNQVNLYKRDELEYASAERQLGPEDKQLAQGMTIQWRQKRITEAGGSFELAKRRAAADGVNFEELVAQQNRLHLIQIFYQKRVIPLIQVAAADIRAYYNANKDKEFTTHGAAKFRMIKFDPTKFAGQRDEAISAAEAARKRALEPGTDFSEVAEQANLDPGLKLTRGAVGKDGWVQQGAFKVDEIDKAVFGWMRPGDVSDLISSASDAMIYVVKLEELKEGKVEAFEDPLIQDRIREKLRSTQFQALRDKHVQNLERNAITRTNEGTLKSTVDMIMMRYPQWAAAK